MADDFYTNIEARHRNPNGYGLTNGFMCQATIEWSSCSNMWGYVALRSINNGDCLASHHKPFCLSVVSFSVFPFKILRSGSIFFWFFFCFHSRPEQTGSRESILEHLRFSLTRLRVQAESLLTGQRVKTISFVFLDTNLLKTSTTPSCGGPLRA